VAQPGSARRSGRRGPRFKSGRPDEAQVLRRPANRGERARSRGPSSFSDSGPFAGVRGRVHCGPIATRASSVADPLHARWFGVVATRSAGVAAVPLVARTYGTPPFDAAVISDRYPAEYPTGVKALSRAGSADWVGQHPGDDRTPGGHLLVASRCAIDLGNEEICHRIGKIGFAVDDRSMCRLACEPSKG
jgi:hypothetical protein